MTSAAAQSLCSACLFPSSLLGSRERYAVHIERVPVCSHIRRISVKRTHIAVRAERPGTCAVQGHRDGSDFGRNALAFALLILPSTEPSKLEPLLSSRFKVESLPTLTAPASVWLARLQGRNVLSAAPAVRADREQYLLGVLVDNLHIRSM